jgi:hypothetical protein
MILNNVNADFVLTSMDSSINLHIKSILYNKAPNSTYKIY